MGGASHHIVPGPAEEQGLGRIKMVDVLALVRQRIRIVRNGCGIISVLGQSKTLIREEPFQVIMEIIAVPCRFSLCLSHGHSHWREGVVDKMRSDIPYRAGNTYACCLVKRHLTYYIKVFVECGQIDIALDSFGSISPNLQVLLVADNSHHIFHIYCSRRIHIDTTAMMRDFTIVVVIGIGVPHISIRIVIATLQDGSKPSDTCPVHRRAVQSQFRIRMGHNQWLRHFVLVKDRHIKCRRINLWISLRIRLQFGVRIVRSWYQEIGIVSLDMTIQTIHLHVIQSYRFIILNHKHSTIVGSWALTIWIGQTFIGRSKIECSITKIIISFITMLARPIQRMSTRIAIEL